MKVSIGYATAYQLKQMYQRFYPEQPLARSQLFAERVLSARKNVSMAQVQGYFMFYKSEPAAVLENIDKLWTL